MARRRPDFRRGTLDLLVLKARSSGPLRSFGIVQCIRQLAEDMLTGEGSLYRSAAGLRASGACLRKTAGLAMNR